jgi:toxin HigB-1
MIETFRHKGLAELFKDGATTKIAVTFHKRILVRLDALDTASDLTQLNQPGFNLHSLHTKPQRYSIHVNGPWCLTFEWEPGKARRVDLEQYH